MAATPVKGAAPSSQNPPVKPADGGGKAAYLSKGNARCMLITAFVLSLLLAGAGVCALMGQMTPGGIFAPFGNAIGDLGTYLFIGTGGLLFLIAVAITLSSCMRKEKVAPAPGAAPGSQPPPSTPKGRSSAPQGNSKLTQSATLPNRSGRESGSGRRAIDPRDTGVGLGLGGTTPPTGAAKIGLRYDRPHDAQPAGPARRGPSGAATRENAGRGPAGGDHIGRDRIVDL